MKKDKKTPSSENPYKLLDLKLTGVKKWAAGVPAVMASFSDLFEEKVPIRGTRALFTMNQRGGFDCLSCAWPDPDDERSTLGEYCENGAKALAEEATTKKVTQFNGLISLITGILLAAVWHYHRTGPEVWGNDQKNASFYSFIGHSFFIKPF